MMKTRQLIVTLALILCASTAWEVRPGFGWQLVGGGGTFTGILYSGFENETDDAKATTQPTGWNDDYTALVLAGNESAFTEGDDAANTTLETVWNITATPGATTYARIKFRISSYVYSTFPWCFGAGMKTAAGADIGGISVRLSTTIASSFLLGFSGDSTVDPVDTSQFSSGTYYLYLIYTPGTSMTAEIRDSDFNLVSGWAGTRTGTNTATPGSFFTYVGGRGVDIIWDDVEVRHDTAWGN